MNKAALLFASSLFVSLSANASVIVMKNGDRITGTIKRAWDDEVYIEPEYADEFSVDQSEIVSIEDDRPLELELKDGRDIVGSLVGVDAAGNQIIAADGVEIAVPLGELAELEEPEKYMDWATHFDINTAINKGNTDSQNVKFSGDAMYKLGRQRHMFDFLFTTEEQNGLTTKDRDFYRYNFNYEVAEPWFLGSSASYEKDPIKNLDYRYNVIPAAGYDIWNDPGRTFALQLGAGYQAEKSATLDDAGAVAAFLIRFDYDFGSPDVQIYLNNMVTAAFYGRDNVVNNFVSGMRYEITDLLYLNFELDVDYESEPLPGAVAQDVSLLFGLGVEFEK